MYTYIFINFYVCVVEIYKKRPNVSSSKKKNIWDLVDRLIFFQPVLCSFTTSIFVLDFSRSSQQAISVSQYLSMRLFSFDTCTNFSVSLVVFGFESRFLLLQCGLNSSWRRKPYYVASDPPSFYTTFTIDFVSPTWIGTLPLRND